MESSNGQVPSRGRSAALLLAAIGVVFGDIGTSPLYAMRQCFVGDNAAEVNAGNVLGVASVVFWSLMIVVCLKYVWLVLKADNRGEGGILALMALVDRHTQPSSVRLRTGIMWLGVAGAALLYGDGIVTPSISVLSAVEGLNVATPLFEPYIVPASIVILALLFAVQKRGTLRVGAVFGPVLCIWFAVIAALGLRSIAATPAILKALAPHHAVSFLASGGGKGFLLMGTVFLTVTGAEVLYADMGHFGRRPIRCSWLLIVMPALTLNYLGQGAYLLRDGSTAENLFYQICPPALLYPCVALATAATVIASQAVISGTFSLARQATQLGIWPRLRIVHTSASEIGQVYVPAVNAALFAGTIALILGFRESGHLASAYGIAVSATMLITTILLLMLCHSGWKIRPVFTFLIGALLIPIDLAFFLSNAAKISSGGWVILLVSAAIFAASLIWKGCRAVLRRGAEVAAVDPAVFVADVRERKPLRVAGTAVFFTPNPNGLPRALLHNFKHNKVLHSVTALLTVKNMDVPAVRGSERISAEELGEGFYRIIVRYGFSETPDIPAALAGISMQGVSFAPANTTFFLGKESLVLREAGVFSMAVKRIFLFMSRNSLDVSSFYGLPPTRVVEMGAQEQL